MNRTGYFRILLIAVFAALVLSSISILLLNRLADVAASRHRAGFYIFLTEAIEQNINGRSIEELKEAKDVLLDGPPSPGMGFGPPPGDDGAHPFPPPPPPSDERFGEEMRRRPFPPPPGPGGPPGGPGGPPPGMHADLWLVAANGAIIASNTGSGRAILPKAWVTLEKPRVVHEIAAKEDLFRISPGVYVIKLDHIPDLYLVAREPNRRLLGPLFVTHTLLTFATVATAIFFALALTFFYLRKKSLEARAVLLRLEQGDLQARFEIKRFDEFGGLLLDFNRMASEIEKLVSRLQTTEAARKNLLQELGHDLRTPLTCLTTSFETLKFHFAKMSEHDRAELFTMIEAEVEYFTELLEGLMTIAALDEPNYKKSTEIIDLGELLAQEIRARQSVGASPIHWSIGSIRLSAERLLILGDPHLVMRVFKNAFDNAARFARSEIRVEFKEQSDRIEVVVVDDGPGLSEADLARFGKRREHRMVREGSGLNFSLGLGSVIMKTIAELHEGRVEMRNRQSGTQVQGAELTISLPKVKPAAENR